MESDTNRENTPIVSTGEWVASKFLLLIPVVNIILLIIWSLSKSENQNKVNWARATLFIFSIDKLYSFDNSIIEKPSKIF